MSSEAPVCLISQQGDELRVHDDGLALLASLGSAPLATLAVAGNYRTGKSFFLNQLVGARNTVGSTTESCTRGIWAWVAPPEVWRSAADPSARLLVLDTEGLASIDQDETYDAKVFSLGILLSSFFIYNSMGVIDESAVDRLFLVGELTKNVCLSSDHAAADSQPSGGDGAEVGEDELAAFFPPFLWLLRDFHLDLEKDGEAIGLPEYLETALEDRPGSSSRVKENNRIRRSFKALFRDRKCATLVRPVNEESELKQLPTLSDAELRPQFVTEMAAIRAETLQAVQTKQLYGKTVSAPMLATLARSYVDAINGGAVPDIRKSWDYVVEETLRTAYESAAGSFASELRAAAVAQPLPSRASLDTTQRRLAASSKATFVSMCGSAIESTAAEVWREKLDSTAAEEWAAALASLESASKEQCSKLAEELFVAAVDQKIDAGEFDDSAFSGSPEASAGSGAGAASLAASAAEAEAAYRDGSAGPAVESVLCSALAKHGLPAGARLARRVGAEHSAALAAANANHATELAAREGLEAVLQGKEQLVETLRASTADLETQLAKSQAACDELSTAKATLQESCHQTEMAKGVLEQQLGELGRRLTDETERAASREQELNSRYLEAKQASEVREAALEGRLMEVEARLDDARLEGTSMMEQIAELKAEVASELRAQEELKKQHDRALAEQQAILDDERRARQEEQQQNAAALAAAAAQARAEALARQAADGRADCAGVMESLINGVENSVKIKQFREQLEHVTEERDAVKAQLEDFCQKASHVPAAFQEQIFGGTPKWLQDVIDGKAVGGAGGKGAGGDGKGEDEECVLQ